MRLYYLCLSFHLLSLFSSFKFNCFEDITRKERRDYEGKEEKKESDKIEIKKDSSRSLKLQKEKKEMDKVHKRMLGGLIEPNLTQILPCIVISTTFSLSCKTEANPPLHLFLIFKWSWEKIHVST